MQQQKGSSKPYKKWLQSFEFCI